MKICFKMEAKKEVLFRQTKTRESVTNRRHCLQVGNGSLVGAGGSGASEEHKRRGMWGNPRPEWWPHTSRPPGLHANTMKTCTKTVEDTKQWARGRSVWHPCVSRKIYCTLDFRTSRPRHGLWGHRNEPCLGPSGGYVQVTNNSWSHLYLCAFLY